MTMIYNVFFCDNKHDGHENGCLNRSFVVSCSSIDVAKEVARFRWKAICDAYDNDDNQLYRYFIEIFEVEMLVNYNSLHTQIPRAKCVFCINQIDGEKSW